MRSQASRPELPSLCAAYRPCTVARNGILLGGVYEVDAAAEDGAVHEGVAHLLVRRVEIGTAPPASGRVDISSASEALAICVQRCGLAATACCGSNPMSAPLRAKAHLAHDDVTGAQPFLPNPIDGLHHLISGPFGTLWQVSRLCSGGRSNEWREQRADGRSRAAAKNVAPRSPALRTEVGLTRWRQRVDGKDAQHASRNGRRSFI